MYWDLFEIVFWGLWLSMWPFYWHHMRAIVEAEHFGTHTELRLFLLLTATKLWITSSKHAGKISFPTQVRKKRRNTDITYYYACIRLLHISHWDKNHFLIIKLLWIKESKNDKKIQEKPSIHLNFRAKNVKKKSPKND